MLLNDHDHSLPGAGIAAIQSGDRWGIEKHLETVLEIARPDDQRASDFYAFRKKESLRQDTSPTQPRRAVPMILSGSLRLPQLEPTQPA